MTVTRLEVVDPCPAIGSGQSNGRSRDYQSEADANTPFLNWTEGKYQYCPLLFAGAYNAYRLGGMMLGEQALTEVRKDELIGHHGPAYHRRLTYDRPENSTGIASSLHSTVHHMHRPCGSSK